MLDGAADLEQAIKHLGALGAARGQLRIGLFMKTLRQEKEGLEREIASIRRELGGLLNEKERLEGQVERLLSERDTIRMKVEAMLDAIATLDPEMAEAVVRR